MTSARFAGMGFSSPKDCTQAGRTEFGSNGNVWTANASQATPGSTFFADLLNQLERHVLAQFPQGIEFAQQLFPNELRDIREAKERLAEGQFGRCDLCGEFIGFRRLVMQPTAMLCSACYQ